MKTKPLIFALGLCLILLSGCAATVGVGPDYGYYPPVRPYYAPRPVVVVPAPYYVRPDYRQPYRGYGGYHGYRDNGYRPYGSYGGHSRRRGD